jgi:hypothetical protein
MLRTAALAVSRFDPREKYSKGMPSRHVAGRHPATLLRNLPAENRRFSQAIAGGESGNLTPGPGSARASAGYAVIPVEAQGRHPFTRFISSI